MQGVLESFWDDVASGQSPRDLVRTVFEGLSKELEAPDAFWVGLVRMQWGPKAEEDAMKGWRIRCFDNWHPPNCEDLAKFQAYMRKQSEPSLSTRTLAAQHGKFRACHLYDGTIDLAAFEKTELFQRLYRDLGVSDRIWCIAPVSEEAESCFCFDRQDGTRFTTAEVEFVSQALRPLKWLHKQILFGYGLPKAEKPLPPTYRRVLDQLLQGRSEKEIANVLNLAQTTTHSYITEIYRALGVQSRAELSAMWMGKW